MIADLTSHHISFFFLPNFR